VETPRSQYVDRDGVKIAWQVFGAGSAASCAAKIEHVFAPNATENHAPLATSMVALGHGSFVRADRVFAVIPIDGPDRGNGQRTYVHVEGVGAPLVASRSERAILADLQRALVDETPQQPRRRLLRRGAHRTAVRSS
jgi:hypothetical protein